MPLTLSIVTRTDVGQRRSKNEDAVDVEPDLGILVVADGMGGHVAGHVASRIAVEEAVGSIRGAVEESSGPVGGDDMAEAVKAADQRVRTEGLRDPSRAGMGTTLTAFHLDAESGRYHIGHVGDSRAYRFRDGELEQLTHDDTWVQSQVDAGRFSEEQARNHPWSSLLSQAVGMEDPVDPRVYDGEAEAGDVFLLCSDGLMAMLTDPEIEELLGRRLSEGLEATADALVDEANDRGGVDNITVGLMRVD